jgi:hypothetical protein
VWLDCDGDRKYSSPYEYAAALVRVCGSQAPKILPALAGYDEAIAEQAASICVAEGRKLRSREFLDYLTYTGPKARRGFERFMQTLP